MKNGVSTEMKTRLRKDGAIKVAGLLDSDLLAQCRACFDWSIAHPGSLSGRVFQGTGVEHYSDIANRESVGVYASMLRAGGFADLFAELWGSRHIWYFIEEIIAKDASSGGGRSPWHQDTAYLPISGEHIVNCWISFDAVPQRNSLEFVRGSHHGPIYGGTAYEDPSYGGESLGDRPEPESTVKGDELPSLPDIEGERLRNPASWDVLSWPVAPGDVLLFHPGILHGGAPVDASCPRRNTLVLRFLGDDVAYRPRPKSDSDFFFDFRAESDPALKAGEPYRSSRFLQLR